MSFELSQEYVAASAFRFLSQGNPEREIRDVYARLAGGETCLDLGALEVQPGLREVA